MKATFTINEIVDHGDSIKVVAQGHYDSDAEFYKGTRSITLNVPVQAGNRYTIGRQLRVTVKPVRS